MNRLVKTNVPGLLKDSKTGLIVNTNQDELNAVRARRKASRAVQNEIAFLKAEIQKLWAAINNKSL